MGAGHVISVDETMEHSVNTVTELQETGAHGRVVSSQFLWIVLLFAAAVYLGCVVSPPSLMDDVDAVQAQIARNMLSSGDWVTARSSCACSWRGRAGKAKLRQVVPFNWIYSAVS